jgi:3-oxoacyl-[acyl-carrier-protein] synthase III
VIAIETIASALPARVLTNAELKAEHPDWDFDRLEQRTGVVARHVAAEGETALDLALQACRELEARNQLRAEEIDALIFCTQSPDYIMPPNSCLMHGKLGLRTKVLALDINLACSGYIYGLRLGASLIESGAAKRVLLATADTYTRYIHPGDRATRCLFGDGAAVSILAASKDGRGIRDIRCGTSGAHHEQFVIPAGGMRRPRSSETSLEVVDQSGNVRTAEHIVMDGLGVLSFFNKTVPASVREILIANQLTLGDIDVFVFHQASKVALDSIRTALKIPTKKMVIEFSETGNLVSASIPVALVRALANGFAKSGQLALLCGFGVGLSWGCAIVRL